MTNDGITADSLFEQMLAEQNAARRPPVDQWQPERVGEIDIRIGRDGAWYHQGSRIQRPAMVKLFSSILRREGDAYYLVTPAEKLAIEVEDAPFQAILLERDGSGPDQRLLFTTNVDEHVLADAEHPIEVTERDGEPAPYVMVRAGLWARISRNVFYQLADIAEPLEHDPSRLGVRSSGEVFVLGKV